MHSGPAWQSTGHASLPDTHHACRPLAAQEARRKLRNAVVCGYISSADRGTHLNPPDLQQLSRYDKVGGRCRSRRAALAGHACCAACLLRISTLVWPRDIRVQGVL